MTRRLREVKPSTALFSRAIPGRKWGIFLPRRIIWQKWQEIVGDAVSRQAWPWFFLDLDCLVIAVSDNVWMQQLTYQRGLILEGMNRYLPEGSRLRDLKFFLGDVEEVRKLTGPRKITGKKQDMRKDVPVPPGKAFDLLDVIQDRELKERLRNLLEKASRNASRGKLRRH